MRSILPLLLAGLLLGAAACSDEDESDKSDKKANVEDTLASGDVENPGDSGAAADGHAGDAGKSDLPPAVPCKKDGDCGPRGWCNSGGCQVRWAVDVEAGRHFSCVRLGLGGYSCWGRNEWAQLGDGTKTTRTVPNKPRLAGEHLHGLATGSYHACIIDGDSRAQCFGRDTVGQSTGVQGKSILWPALVGASTLRRGVSIHAGYQHSCGLGVDGYVTCWGSRTYGQTGGRAMPRAAHRVPYVEQFSALDVANVYSCGIRKGKVWCWGSNSNGQIGNGRTAHHEPLTEVKGLGDVVSIATGSRHACIVNKAGAIKCWGKGSDGQLGDGQNKASSLPVAVTALADVDQLDASPYHTCARKGGEVWCWGANTYGQLGTGDTKRRSQPVKVAGISDAIDVAAGFWHTCALHRDGSLSCWGRNEYGTIGIGTKSKKPELSPVNVQAPIPECASDAECTKAADPCTKVICDPKTNHCASSKSSDDLKCVDDSGSCGFSGVCKAGACVLKDGCDDGNACTAPVCGPGGVCKQQPATMRCGDGDKCASATWCAAGTCKAAPKTCDDGNPCTLDSCDGKTGTCKAPSNIDGPACEDDNACTTGDACKAGACVGNKVDCAHGCHPEAGCLASEEPNLHPAKYEIAAGHDFTCAVGPGGHRACWGVNDHGQLGNGKIGGIVSKPVWMADGATGIDVHAGDAFACLRQDAGKVGCWGRNDAGQLGTGATSGPVTAPSFIKGLATRHPLALGRNHGCALLDGRVWCWGSDAHGQLGGSFGTVKAPIKVPGAPLADSYFSNRAVRSLAAGGDTTCMSSNGRNVFCWGRCEHGVCGPGANKAGTIVPIRFVRTEGKGFIGTFRSIAVGNGFACAMTPARTVCWGRGDHGQLGRGAFGGSELPRQVRLVPRWTGWLDAGGNHACALGGDDRQWPSCWGHSGSGQLGVGSTKSRAWAVKTRAIGAAVRVAAGFRHTCWTTREGTIRCAGYNAVGRLGVGSKKNTVTSPTTVKFPSIKLPMACTVAADCGPKATCDKSVACEHGRCHHRPKECANADACIHYRCDPAKGCVSNNVADADSVVCQDGAQCGAPSRCIKGSCKAVGACLERVSISGKVTFDWIPALASSEGGIRLGYEKTEARPARRIVVQAVALSKAATVLDETISDVDGSYGLEVPKGATVKVRALAHLRIDEWGTPWTMADIRAVDNTNDKAQWAIESPALTGPKKGVNLHAATKWDAKKSVHIVRQSGPFALMDTAFEVVKLVAGDQGADLPALHINWSPGNMPLPGYKDQGQIGPSSHYTTELGMPVIYLKGFENINTDEYDDHIVAHEIGHHVENALFRSDSIGGRHSSYNSLEGRIAFGEGYANALSAMALKDPIYVNVSGKNQKGGFQLDFSAPITGDDRATYSEKAVAWMLVKLWDGRDSKPNSGKFDRIRWVLENVHEPTDTFTSIVRFVHGYHGQFGKKVDGDNIQKLFTVDLDTPMPSDRWDTANVIGKWYAGRRTYPQGSGVHRGPEFWQAYRTLKTGENKPTAHEMLDIAGYTYPQNKLGGSRWYRLKGTGKTATVAVEKPIGGKCTTNLMDLRAYRLGRAIKWDVRNKGEFAGCPKITFPTTAEHWYMLDVRMPYSEPKDVQGWTMRVSWK